MLLPLAGAPVLLRMLERVLAARTSDDLVVATTERREDDGLVDAVHRFGVRVFRGHPTDLLDRHYRAALAAGADVVVKIPSDCPLIDPAAIDRVLVGLPGSDTAATTTSSNLHPAELAGRQRRRGDDAGRARAGLRARRTRPTSASTRRRSCGTSRSGSGWQRALGDRARPTR